MSVVIPRFQYSRLDGKRTAVLEEDMMFPCTGIENAGYAMRLHTLNNWGDLQVREGFHWDLGSGAIDTPAMIYASIPHDALYEAMNTGRLHWKHRKAADEYFIWLLKMAGTPWWRRAYIWIAVRYGYPIAKRFKLGGLQ